MDTRKIVFCIFEPRALEVHGKVIELFGKYFEAVSGPACINSVGTACDRITSELGVRQPRSA
jgi:hypothetical protein